jgi:hypothetical protein
VRLASRPIAVSSVKFAVVNRRFFAAVWCGEPERESTAILGKLGRLGWYCPPASSSQPLDQLCLAVLPTALTIGAASRTISDVARPLCYHQLARNG